MTTPGRQKPLTRSRAVGCLVTNLLLTPGLGSLMGRRKVAGAGQLTVFLAGFGLFVLWFLDVLRQYYGLLDHDADPHLHNWLAFAGIGIAAFAWLWALATSVSLVREAGRNEREGRLVEK